MYTLMISLTFWGRFTAIYCTGNLNLLGDPSSSGFLIKLDGIFAGNLINYD
jgi:hypothetical protein